MMPKDRLLKVIFIVSIIIAIVFPLVNIYFIYPMFTNLLVEHSEEEAERTANHLKYMLMTSGEEAHHASIHESVEDVNQGVSMQQEDESSLIYTIQTGSFRRFEDAQQHYKSVMSMLPEDIIDYLRIEKIGDYFTLRLGKFNDPETAGMFLDGIRSMIPSAIRMQAYMKRDRIVEFFSGDHDTGADKDLSDMPIQSQAAPMQEVYISPTFVNRIRELQEHFQFIKLKVFASDGKIIYSTSPADIGKINTKKYFKETVSQGHKFSKVVKKDKKTAEGQVLKSDVIEIYIPIMENGRFAGAFEIYYDITKRTGKLHEVIVISSILPFIIMSLFLLIIMLGIYKLDSHIIERRHAEEALTRFTRKLEQSNQELQDFAHTASHDLQEPLRKVIFFGERLKGKYADVLGEQGRDYLERMQNASKRMRNLIDGLLMFSRVNTKAQPFQPVDLEQTARDVLSDLEVRIKDVGGQVELGQLEKIEADPLQVRQLFQNLIGNALKFHKEGESPVIRVTGSLVEGDSDGDGVSASKGMYYQIVFEDNGIGFDQKYADRIFGAFKRLHGRNEYEGTGIGLSVCRKIVERHGGNIKAEGKPGHGARFIVNLPVEHQKIKEVVTEDIQAEQVICEQG